MKFQSYVKLLNDVLEAFDWQRLEKLCDEMMDLRNRGGTFYICGNGGSAGNAVHMANDFIYGAGGGKEPGLKVHALPANSSILTCIGNDEGYEKIFSLQLKTLASPEDHLMVLSGSGNSPNVVEALKTAKVMGITTSAVLGFSGGACKGLVDHPLHFDVDDMQIAEDCQQVVCHMMMKDLCKRILENA